MKGPQAPVYFVAITAAYLAFRRDWRFILRWQYAAGVLVFLAIIAAWQIPFWLATDFESVAATWAGLATDRVHLAGLAKHVVAYPLETFACLLPWSPILVALVKRETRTLVTDEWPMVSFMLVALAVAYPTVWIVAGAQARYFMPLYPLIAVLVGLVVERCSQAAVDGYPRRAWHQFLLLSSTIIASLCVLAFIRAKWALGSYQPLWFSFSLLLLAAVAVVAIWICYKASSTGSRLAAVCAIALFAGIAQAGLFVNFNRARWNDPTVAVAEIQEIISSGKLVSLSPIDHRFAYLYQQPIAELAWPREVDDLPPDAEYFCFMRHPCDTAQEREAGRGRSWTTTPGTLPFAWEEVATLCVERRIRDYPATHACTRPRRQAADGDGHRRHRTATRHQSHRDRQQCSSPPLAGGLVPARRTKCLCRVLGRTRLKMPRNRRINHINRQIPHAAMMPQRTDPLHARLAFERE